MEASCGKLRVSCVNLRVSCGTVRVACGKECAFLATSLVGTLFPLRVLGCAERSRRALEPILWYRGTVRFNEYAQSGAVRDEVVELEPSFEHLPPSLKPCFPVALRKMASYTCM